MRVQNDNVLRERLGDRPEATAGPSPTTLALYELQHAEALAKKIADSWVTREFIDPSGRSGAQRAGHASQALRESD
jgi:hypothetical protein